ncbi:MAG: BatA and WFA domain-containing protein [Planctomycetaceae bacterium]|nr:BatA and WFA domain-containing protein [Planctomycetaceae bacterium]
MSFGVLNSLMLLGLVAVMLPVIAHLLSKRRYDVVYWGAMRFLELGRRTRQRIRIQDLLLLFLRMAMIACVALALARPWGSGALVGGLAESVARDVVFVIDGSTSMAWQEDGITPHQQAIQSVHESLEELGGADSVSIIDARRTPRLVVGPVTGDWKPIRDALATLPEPSGMSNIPAAVAEAIKLLAKGTHVAREVIVLADDQRFPWQSDNVYAWERVDDRLRQSEIRPVIRSVTVGPQGKNRVNVSVGPIELSRELTVPEFPVRIRAQISQSGETAVQKRVRLEIGGKRLDEKSTEVHLLPQGESTVEFEHVFASEGSFLVSVVVEDDPLPQDNRSEAVIVVSSGIPVLLVDGDARLDETNSETFFAKSVFASSGKRSPWVRATVIRPSEWNDSILEKTRVVFLANIPRLSLEQWAALGEFIANGGGVVIAPGDRIEPDHWNALVDEDSQPLLPAELTSIEQDQQQPDAEAISISSDSLEDSWLRRFRKETGVDFWQTRFAKWWKLAPRETTTGGDEEVTGNPESETGLRVTAEVLGSLSNGDPLLVSRDLGQGSIVLLAVPLDADWSTWPAKNDFVPFLHEMVFHLTSTGVRRNLEVGEPLFISLDDEDKLQDFVVSGPGVEKGRLREVFQRGLRLGEFGETEIPGRYEVRLANNATETEHYVVREDGQESDLRSLQESDWQLLAADDRIERATDPSEALALKAENQPRAELWWLLLGIVVVMLIGEVALTRKMVQEGHAALEELEAVAV